MGRAIRLRIAVRVKLDSSRLQRQGCQCLDSLNRLLDKALTTALILTLHKISKIGRTISHLLLLQVVERSLLRSFRITFISSMTLKVKDHHMADFST